MTKRYEMRIALVVMVVALVASIRLDCICAAFCWSYPDFNVTTSDVRVCDIRVWPFLTLLRKGVGHATLLSLVAVTSMFVCWGRKGREDVAVAILSCAACLYVVACRQPAVAESVDRLLAEARNAIVAAYPLVCLTLSRFCRRRADGSAALALGLAAHVAAVVFCAWDGSGYALGVSVPTVVWMALGWTLFAAPVHLAEWLRTLGTRRKVALTALSVLVQTSALSMSRLHDIGESLALPARPEPGWFDSNWATTHISALAAFPTSSFADLVHDPALLVGLQRIPLAWLGVAGTQGHRLAYAAILVAFLTSVFVVWRCARRSASGTAVEAIALAVMLSNLWGLLCSVFSLTSTGVVTLASGNPFQLVPIACLLMAGILST